MKKIIFGITLLILNVTTSYTQVNDVKLYTFGHSLIDHRPPAIPTPSDETTILHWIHDIAQEAGKSFSTGGQYGFLTSHDDNLPPSSQWGYDNVPSVWDETQEAFSEADINTILLTAANFIQYVPPSDPHPLDNSTTVIQSTETIFDWVHQEESTAKFYIYLNWPEMDLPNAYPPTPPAQIEIDAFHNLTIGSFSTWWTDYQDALLLSRPLLNTRLIPVGPVISKILKDLIPNQVPFTELYEDSAPHGRASLYFLAGMITYMAIYEEKIPNSYVPDNIVHQALRDNLSTINNFIWNELLNYNLPSGQSRVFASNINLPVEYLAEFTARIQEEIVLLEWTTASEFNSASFEIERSNDGRHWEVIAKIKAANQSKAYKEIDRSPLSPISYYRLKQIDFDKKSSYSNMASIAISDKNINTKLFPNPTKGILNISTNRKINTIEIFNALGERVRFLQNPTRQIRMDELTPGVYFVEIQSGYSITTHRVLVE